MNVFKMPEKRADLFHFFSRLHPDSKIWIEMQSVRHSDLKSGAVFRIVDNLIRNYHDILFCCEVLNLSHEIIPATKWEKKYKPLPKVYDKKKSVLGHIAKRKYPGLKTTLQTCDAVLILEHALIQKSYEY